MMVRRRRDKRLWYVLGVVFVAVGFFSFLRQGESGRVAEAASLEKFDAGYIISDYQMENFQSMTEKEIQEFLSKKNSCKNTNETLYKDLTAKYQTVRWHFEEGHFVCLSEEMFGDGVLYGEDLKDGEGETAAKIIWQAAQDYKINPQVLLVLLEKEQGLVTDQYPHSGQYRSATGYGCPDTAACDAKYYGFKNQVRNAAKMFRTVMDGGWTNYPLGKNYIQYNPSASCGGSVVEIKNLATSALYRYTPYQPNAAALAAGYGTATCGAYGNRNFYLYFEDWFGGVVEEAKEIVASEEKQTNTIEKNDIVEGESADAKVEVKAASTTDEKQITKDVIPSVTYVAHVQNIGWMDWVKNNAVAGTTGKSLRMEALKIKLDSVNGIMYQSHLQDIGWENKYVSDGKQSGTTGESRRLEAIKIKLSDELAKKYDVCYRAHVQNIGWMDWVKNNAVAGTTGKSLRMEALIVRIVVKGAICSEQ